jgi:pimeloyl-ACP methyl ester carboxylesterase
MISIASARKQVGDLNVNYLAAGSGPPLVLLHGMGGRAQSFERMIEILAEQFTVYAFDQRGAGSTERPPEPKISFEVWRDDVLLFLDALGLEKVALAGWSLGAETALHVALAAPQRVSHIVMLGAGAGPGVPNADRTGFDARKKLIQSGASQEEIVARTFAFTIKSLSADTQKNKPHVIEKIRREHLANHPPSYLEMIHASEDRTPLEKRLAEIRCPTLILCGDEDTRTPLVHSEAFNRAIPSSYLKIIRDCGHHYGVEQPEASCRSIIEFVQAFGGRGAQAGPTTH